MEVMLAAGHLAAADLGGGVVGDAGSGAHATHTHLYGWEHTYQPHPSVCRSISFPRSLMVTFVTPVMSTSLMPGGRTSARWPNICPMWLWKGGKQRTESASYEHWTNIRSSPLTALAPAVWRWKLRGYDSPVSSPSLVAMVRLLTCVVHTILVPRKTLSSVLSMDGSLVSRVGAVAQNAPPFKCHVIFVGNANFRFTIHSDCRTCPRYAELQIRGIGT